MKSESVLDVAFNLDEEHGSLSCGVKTLEDIQSVLSSLRVDMDNVDESQLRIYFRDFHLKVRLVDDLLRHTVREVDECRENIMEIKNNLIQEVRNNKKA